MIEIKNNTQKKNKKGDRNDRNEPRTETTIRRSKKTPKVTVRTRFEINASTAINPVTQIVKSLGDGSPVRLPQIRKTIPLILKTRAGSFAGLSEVTRS